MPLSYQSLNQKPFKDTHINHIVANRRVLYCRHQTGLFLSVNVLLIVLSIIANNASDKISWGEPLSWCKGFRRNPPSHVNTPLLRLCLSQHTWAHQRPTNSSQVNTLTPVSVYVCVEVGATQNNRPSFVPDVLVPLIRAHSMSLLDSWVGLWRIHNEAMPQISTRAAAFEETAQVVRS